MISILRYLNIDLIAIQLFNYVIITIYRPPDTDLIGTSNLYNNIECLSSSSDNCFIYGDINLAGICWLNGTCISPSDILFYNMIQINGFIQINRLPYQE